MAFIDLFLYFVLYSFLGWCCESLYCSVKQKKWVNRGFLNGPFCPVYGFGALLVLFLLRNVRHSFLALFLSGMVVTSVLEYITSVILERLFHMHWWDYSHMRFNVNGRICLLNSCEFGLLSVLVVMYIHPALRHLIDQIPGLWRGLLAAALLLILIADTVTTVHGLLVMKGRLDDLTARMAELRLKTKEGREKLQLTLSERADNLREELDGRAESWRTLFTARMEIMEADYNSYKAELEQKFNANAAEYRKNLEENRQKLDALRDRMKQLDKSQFNRWIYKRLMRAFPNLEAEQNRRFLDELKKKLDNHSKR